MKWKNSAFNSCFKVFLPLFTAVPINYSWMFVSPLSFNQKQVFWLNSFITVNICNQTLLCQHIQNLYMKLQVTFWTAWRPSSCFENSKRLKDDWFSGLYGNALNRSKENSWITHNYLSRLVPERRGGHVKENAWICLTGCAKFTLLSNQSRS